MPDKLFHYIYGNTYERALNYVANVQAAAGCLKTGINVADNNKQVDYELMEKIKKATEKKALLDAAKEEMDEKKSQNNNVNKNSKKGGWSMNNRKAYRMTTFIVTVLCLLFSMSTIALAAGPGKIDKNAKGSLNIKFVDTDEKPITGGNVEVFYIASIVEDSDGNDVYELTSDFSSLTIDYSDLGSKSFISNAFAIVEANGLEGITKDIDANCFSLFDDLAVGV